MSWSRIKKEDKIFGDSVGYHNADLQCRITIRYPTEDSYFKTVKLEYVNSIDNELLQKYKEEFGKNLAHTPRLEAVVFSYPIAEKKQNAESTERFLQLFLSHHNLQGSEISAELRTLCGLRTPEGEITKSLLAMVDKNEIDAAINEAKECQKKMYYEAIWALTEYLSDRIELNKLYKLYKSIDEKNPHYTEAREIMMSILMQLPVEEDNKIDLLEMKFKVALSTNQPVIADRLFDELCGRPLYEKVGIKNIRGDAEILCQIASQMRAMNQEISRLRMENEKLHSRLLSAEDNTVSKDIAEKIKSPGITSVGVFKVDTTSSIREDDPASNQKTSPSLDRKKK